MSARTILKHVYENGGMTDYQYERIDRVLKERERPHGEWIWKSYGDDYDCGDIVCSKCSVVIHEGVRQAGLRGVTWHFCPNCGARMKGGDEK